MEDISLHSRKLLSEQMATSLVGVGILLVFVAGLMLSLRYLLKVVDEKTKYIKWKPAETPFRETNGYNFDCVFAMQIYESDEELTVYQEKYSHLTIIKALNNAGLETRMFYSVQQDELFIKIRCPPDLLKRYAAKIDFMMALNPVPLLAHLKAGKKDENGEYVWVPIDLMKAQEGIDGQNFKRFPKLHSPTEHIHAAFSESKELQDIYEKYDGKDFRTVDRLRLIKHIIQAPVRDGGCNLNLTKLIQGKAVLGFFPLHNYEELRQMQLEWLKLWAMPMSQPFSQIRNYFGEKIALYFAFTGKFTEFLMFASIAGFITWLNVLIQDTYDAYLVGPFAIFITVWAVVFLEKWKRREAALALEYGMIDFEKTESVRPSYKGEIRQSLVTGKDEIYFPAKLRYPLFAVSQMYILALIIAVIGIIAAMLCINYVTSGGGSNSIDPSIYSIHIGSILVFTILSIITVVLGDLFTKIAIYFTENENHRTDTNFQDSLIVKSFVFNFINSYTVLIYIAFFAKAWNLNCNVRDNDCMEALNYALGTIFLVRVIIGNVLEVMLPALSNQKNSELNTVKEDEKAYLTTNIEACLAARDDNDGWNIDRILEMTAIEEQYQMTQYDTLIDMTCDTQEVVLQFGYVVLFCVSFPMIPFVAFVSNYIEIRVDAWKIGTQSRRPMPEGAEDIGTWQDVMNIMTVLSIIMNGGIIFFASDYLEVLYGQSIELKWKVMIFTVTEHVALIIKYIIEIAINDVPMEVTTQIERQNLIINKVIKNIKDEVADIDEYKRTLLGQGEGGDDDLEDFSAVCESHEEVSLTIYPEDDAYTEKSFYPKKKKK